VLESTRATWTRVGAGRAFSPPGAARPGLKIDELIPAVVFADPGYLGSAART
jgi:hypothetical protein